jgi:hypothetical protein
MAAPSPPALNDLDTSAVSVLPSEKSISPNESKEDLSDGLRSRADSGEKVSLADRATQDPSSSLGDAILRLLRLRKRRPDHDLDSVATQSSVFDTDQAEFYRPKHDWEVSLGEKVEAWRHYARDIETFWPLQNIENFDPDFRWTWREEKKVTRATDLKIMVRHLSHSHPRAKQGG